MDKKSLSERDICSKFITPAIKNSGWDELKQIREEVYFTKGRIIVRGKVVNRGKSNKADYILYYKENIPLAVVEAKDNKHSVEDGIQQALDYAEKLNIPFAFSSNGDGFIFHDKTVNSKKETYIDLNNFPTCDFLWNKFLNFKNIDKSDEKIYTTDFHTSKENKIPRYYQANAINNVLEKIINDQKRLLLVMATGTGKTYTAFQIIWRLWKAGIKKRILYLADRNVLIDQTMVNDFKPFGNAMAKLSKKNQTIEQDGELVKLTNAVDESLNIDTSYEIYLGLYQSIIGNDQNKIYKKLSKDFFDFIIIDECHRGSAKEDSLWREVLDYFSGATHLGLTATPKETKYISNIKYFGEPVYTYSLNQGIEDGFLSPYKIHRIHIDRDIDGYRPEKNKLDRDGRPIEDKIYKSHEFDRKIVIDDRTKLVAKKVTEFLKENNERHQKAIIFCVDREHAGRMRQAMINCNSDIVNKYENYIMRIVSGDDQGLEQLGNFMDPESLNPSIVTTSKLLSTGVDILTCKLIVLDKEIASMTEFKQIIGRGTRVYEADNKYYFTIMDFRGATSHFADPDFDGDPISIMEVDEQNKIVKDEDYDQEKIFEEISNIDIENETGIKSKIYVEGVPAEIIAEKIQYLDNKGKLITEDFRDYTKKTLIKKYKSLENFLKMWNKKKDIKLIIKELKNEGLEPDILIDEFGSNLDILELICSLAFDKKPLTRSEKTKKLLDKKILEKYSGLSKNVLSALIEKYSNQGAVDLTDVNLLRVQPFNKFGTPMEIINLFGSVEDYKFEINKIHSQLYQIAS